MESMNTASLVASTPTVGSETPTKEPAHASADGHGCSAGSADRSDASSAEADLDRALVQRFKGGDESAFAEIVGRYRERIHALASRFLRNHADAEEIAQDTFVRAHRALPEFRGDASLATWLHRIAINLARNRYWYFFRRRRHLTISLDCPLGPESSATFSDLVATTEPDPARQATMEEFVVVVTACMEKLDASHREILTLRNLLHHSYEKIARTLGTNEGTVKSRIARARGKLRELIVDACPEFPADATVNDWFEPARCPAGAA